MNEYLFSRRHPEFRECENSWRHCAEAFQGGADYINRSLIRHVSEIDIEFAERRRRAYYFNYPRCIAERITQYALALPPVRTGADPELVEDWSRSGMRTNEVMRQLSTMLTVYGTVWLQADSPSFSKPVSRSRAAAENLRPYIRILSPLDVTDWSVGSDGKLEWAIIQEDLWVNPDPCRPGERVSALKLLTRGGWKLFLKDSSGIHAGGEGSLPGDELPLLRITLPGSCGHHWFEDAVRISEAILNNESESQMNMVKQMFGLLVVSESFARGVRPQNNGSGGTFAATVARSAAVIESVEEKGISRYITPSGVPGTLLRQENEALKRELFDLTGLSIAAGSREAQTAESKSWDFQNTNCFLASRADMLEQCERKGWEFLHNFDNSIPVPQVVYNREFKVRELEKSIAALLQLSALDAGEKFRARVNSSAVELLSGITPLPEEEKISLMNEFVS